MQTIKTCITKTAYCSGLAPRSCHVAEYRRVKSKLYIFSYYIARGAKGKSELYKQNQFLKIFSVITHFSSYDCHSCHLFCFFFVNLYLVLLFAVIYMDHCLIRVMRHVLLSNGLRRKECQERFYISHFETSPREVLIPAFLYQQHT